MCNIPCQTEWETVVNKQNIQKNMKNFLMFVHTYLWKGGTILNVKTPQYII